MHPLLDALFDKHASDPSKQLGQVRELLATSTLESPRYLLILPPERVVASFIDLQWLYDDSFLLSHVADVSRMHESQVFDVLNGSQWQVSASDTQIVPGRGFPATSSTVNIVGSYVWSPGIDWLPYNAAFLVVHVDGLILGNEQKRLAWFGGGRSTPHMPALPHDQHPENALAHASAMAHHYDSSSASTTPMDSAPTISGTGKAGSPETGSAATSARNRRRNPASDLGRTKSQKEQNMAKVDYSLACLQQDVVSSRELAERFHKAVSAVRSTLIEAGGLYVDTVEVDASGDVVLEGDFAASRPELLQTTSFTLSSVYEYAEARLGSHLLNQLETLLRIESKPPSFFELYKDLKQLDIRQVDIPNFESLDEPAFERAVAEAALILGRLSNARSSTEMCTVFLTSLKTLANPALGTVSADTLLGLFMLTVLRTSEDAAMVLERDLYFVTHFSFQASDTVATRANAGRLSYTLMVVESVLLQLRVEYPRLRELAASNIKAWAAVRGDDREALKEVCEHNPSSLVSRRSGKSVLFMAAEDHNSGLLNFLFEQFPNSFTQDFALKDRDIQGRTLLMAAAADERTASVVLDKVGDNDSFFEARDISKRTVAFYSIPENLVDRIAHKLDWTVRDAEHDTPVLHHIKTGYKRGSTALMKHCTNFLQHIDKNGNSVLHFAVLHNDLDLVHHLLNLPSCVVNWTNRKGATPLRLAQSEEVISTLLEHGADPWFVHHSVVKSPALRSARLGQSSPGNTSIGDAESTASNAGERPYVDIEGTQLHVFKPATASTSAVKTALDFATLSSELQAFSPTSWVPPLQYTYSVELQNTKFGSRFFFSLSQLEMQRLGLWLRQLQDHATFGSSNTLDAFFEASTSESSQQGNTEVAHEAAEDTNREAGGSLESARSETLFPLFGCESEDSMLAFLKLGIDQLESVQRGIENFVRHFSRVQHLQKVHTQLRVNLDAGIGQLCQTTGYNLRVQQSSTFQSLSSQVILNSLSGLSQLAGDLGTRLRSPHDLAAKLEAARVKLGADREKLRSLAEVKPKPAWLASFETKRNTEMKVLEAEITGSKQAIGNLEAEMRATHFSLANELSSFNKAQEEEILNQIRVYSRNQLQSAHETLTKLRFGYISS